MKSRFQQDVLTIHSSKTNIFFNLYLGNQTNIFFFFKCSLSPGFINGFYWVVLANIGCLERKNLCFHPDNETIKSSVIMNYYRIEEKYQHFI